MTDRVVVLPAEVYKERINELCRTTMPVPHNEAVAMLGWTNFVDDEVTFVHESGMPHEPYPADWELSPGVPPGDERRWREFIRQVVDDDA